MRRTLPPTLVAVVVGLLVSAVLSPGFAQGIESYSLVHPFGLASATTTCQFGMGAPISCVWDRGFANPAFAALQDEPNAGLRLSSTDFDNGPDLVSKHLHVVYPLEANERGLQLSLFNLSSNSGGFDDSGHWSCLCGYVGACYCFPVRSAFQQAFHGGHWSFADE